MKNSKFYAFFTGMLLAFDFTGFFVSENLKSEKPLQELTDRENLSKDIMNIGNDFRSVMGGDLHE